MRLIGLSDALSMQTPAASGVARSHVAGLRDSLTTTITNGAPEVITTAAPAWAGYNEAAEPLTCDVFARGAREILHDPSRHIRLKSGMNTDGQITNTVLMDHIRRAMGRPFSRPNDDCCSFAADYVLTVTGIDPAAGFRGSYSDLRGALRLIRGAGGFVAMWKVHMTLAGFDETTDPAVGDVGVVREAGGREIAAVRVVGRWAVKAERGVLIEDLPMVCAWSLDRG